MTHAGQDISVEDRRSALGLALKSRTLARAEQLKAFLRYVAEAELDGRAGELTEHLIGVAVFGRPIDYSQPKILWCERAPLNYGRSWSGFMN